MLPFSYTVTPAMTQDLEKIDAVRRDVLLTVLNPTVALRLTWEVRIARLEHALLLAGRRMSRKQINAVLQNPDDRDEARGPAFFLLRYKDVLDTLRARWLMNADMITAGDLRKLAVRIRVGQEADRSETRFDRAFSYIQSGDNHPVIAAAIVYLAAYDILRFEGLAGFLPRIASLMMLYRAGYDFAGFPVWERWWWEERENLDRCAKDSFHEERCTVWLEAFIKGFLKEAQMCLETLGTVPSRENGDDTMFRLTSRQQQILTVFDQPNFRITNRSVKRRFGISQITASRDLAALARYGFLFSHGKGRSVYYTRVG